ncbi:MAG: type IV secretory system conjugative DNA transfer family protein [Clostridiales bacterium]|nr:type IV secretory system conjugative DNA transfer family protein [Clostridiales bacterium]
MASEEKSVFRNFLRFIFWGAIAAFLASYVVASFIVYDTIMFSLELFADGTFYSVFTAVLVLLALVFLLNLSDDGSKLFGKGTKSKAKLKNKDGKEKYYNTEWMTLKQLKTDPQFKFHYYEQLSTSKNIGIPIRAEVVGNKLQVNMYKSIHTIVIGTTGAGKTTQFVDPTIQILSESAARPCMVITDPKGEIYRDHSEKMRKKGYRVLVFDLKEPFQSSCWNPMTRAYDLNMRAHNLNREVKVHHGDDPRTYGLKCINKEYFREWYEFDGLAFANEPELREHLNGTRQVLKNEAFEDLKDLATTLCPIESNNDPIWERGAKDLVLGTMLAMLEDSENPELEMTRDRFNFYNLSKILNTKDNDQYNPIKSLQEYFQGRDKLSQATQLANQVVANSEKTAKSYMGIVTDRMGLFSDSGICYATSKNDMKLETFADEPTALFIKIPDEKITRHPIATMFVSQLYKILVDVANKRGGSLPRDTYFIMDEFANMPKIQNFDTIITVARSRRIFFTLILQSYVQLTTKYGNEVASTVKDNCNIHIFIGSNDQNTLEEFSKRCGNTTVETESVSASKSGEGKDKSHSTTTSLSVESRPLIYPAELASLKPNSGECIVYILQQNPIRSVFTPSYKCPQYYMEKAVDSYKVPKPLNEAEMFYDIRVRNNKILRGGKATATGSTNNSNNNPFDF